MKKITEKQALKITIISFVVSFVDFILTLFVKNEDLTVIFFLLLFPIWIVIITFLITYIIKKVNNTNSTKKENEYKNYSYINPINHNVNTPQQFNNEQAQQSASIYNNSQSHQAQQVENTEKVNTSNEVSTCENTENSKHAEIRKFPEELSIDGDYFGLRYKYDNVHIVGSQYIEGAEQRINELNTSSFVIISREDDNPKDSRAAVISVMKKGVDYKLGYLQKNSQLYEMFNDFEDRDEPVLAKVDENNPGHFRLGFYKQTSSKKDRLKNSNSKIFTLTGVKNENIQASIACTEVGEELSYDYDYEKDKYYVDSRYGNIGYIPKSQVEIIEDSENIEMYISKITENDDGIYSVKVEMFYD